MFSMLDQENLANTYQTTAAGKPLNQSIRNLQSRTPGATLKTPYRSRNDENRVIPTGKAAQNTFVTPVPRARAPLGAKTINAKAQALQTPAPLNKPKGNQQTSKRSSRARRSIKNKINVLPEQITQEEHEQTREEDSEPEFQYAPPPIVPLPDPPLESDYDITYDCLRPENFTRGVGEIYFQSPKDENGFSISSQREEKAFKKSLEDDLEKILQIPDIPLPNPDEKVNRILSNASKAKMSQKPKNLKDQEARVNTIQSRTAASKLSQFNSQVGPKLPSAITRETASSKQKRKPLFTVSKDSSEQLKSAHLPPPSRGTIGFPKAKEPQSILPKQPFSFNNKQTETTNSVIDQSQISPRKFVALYGEPPYESEMWFRLKELEIRDRRRDEADREYQAQHREGDSLFALDDELNDRLAVMFEDGQSTDDFEL